MPTWTLAEDGKENTSFIGFSNEARREDCENRSVNMGLAARLNKGVALAHGVEIYCETDE